MSSKLFRIEPEAMDHPTVLMKMLVRKFAELSKEMHLFCVEYDKLLSKRVDESSWDKSKAQLYERIKKATPFGAFFLEKLEEAEGGKNREQLSGTFLIQKALEEWKTLDGSLRDSYRRKCRKDNDRIDLKRKCNEIIDKFEGVSDKNFQAILNPEFRELLVRSEKPRSVQLDVRRSKKIHKV